MTNDELKQVLEEKFMDYTIQHQVMHGEIQQCLKSLTSLVETHDRELFFWKRVGQVLVWVVGILVAGWAMLKSAFAWFD